MTIEEFKDLSPVPSDLSAPLRALWHDARGDWETAHHLVQDEPTREAAWVHAYLHRREGDLSNARYWYARAGQPEFDGTLEEEWASVTEALL